MFPDTKDVSTAERYAHVEKMLARFTYSMESIMTIPSFVTGKASGKRGVTYLCSGLSSTVIMKL